MTDERAGAELDLLSCFRDSLIGRNAKGIVHNMNSPLQVLSMQIELLGMDLNMLSSMPCEDRQMASCVRQAVERLGQLEAIVTRINHLVKLVGSRVTDEEQGEEEGPIMAARLVEETVEFWKSDLFFKHRVSVELHMPDVSPVVISKERYLKDALDSILFGCIHVLKGSSSPVLKISVKNVDGTGLVISFEPTGACFPIQDIGRVASLIEGSSSLDGEDLSFDPLDLAFAVAKMSIEKVSGRLMLHEDAIRILLDPAT